MEAGPLVSIIVNNFNYDRFLESAINSALNQTYSNIEVIVVDDGSNDNSKIVIEGFDGRILKVYKKNGGQGSAFNAGFRVSKGEIICFLDSDDLLYPDAVFELMKFFRNQNVVQVNWFLEVIDQQGRKTGEVIPGRKPLEGNLEKLALSQGPLFDWNNTPPTSGNAWARSFLENVLPMPESTFIISADEYLLTLAPVYGSCRNVEEPLGCYRIHGNNNYFKNNLTEKVISSYQKRFEECYKILHAHFKSKGLDSDPESWKKNSFKYIWLQKLNEARKDITSIIPKDCSFILVDANELGERFIEDYSIYPFIERNKEYWGDPIDSDEAIYELRRLNQAGADFIVFWWTAFWWFEHYSQFYSFLTSTFECSLRNDAIVIFDLSKPIRLYNYYSEKSVSI